MILESDTESDSDILEARPPDAKRSRPLARVLASDDIDDDILFSSDTTAACKTHRMVDEILSSSPDPGFGGPNGSGELGLALAAAAVSALDAAPRAPLSAVDRLRSMLSRKQPTQDLGAARDRNRASRFAVVVDGMAAAFRRARLRLRAQADLAKATASRGSLASTTFRATLASHPMGMSDAQAPFDVVIVACSAQFGVFQALARRELDGSLVDDTLLLVFPLALKQDLVLCAGRAVTILPPYAPVAVAPPLPAIILCAAAVLLRPELAPLGDSPRRMPALAPLAADPCAPRHPLLGGGPSLSQAALSSSGAAHAAHPSGTVAFGALGAFSKNVTVAGVVCRWYPPGEHPFRLGELRLVQAYRSFGLGLIVEPATGALAAVGLPQSLALELGLDTIEAGNAASWRGLHLAGVSVRSRAVVSRVGGLASVMTSICPTKGPAAIAVLLPSVRPDLFDAVPAELPSVQPLKAGARKRVALSGGRAMLERLVVRDESRIRPSVVHALQAVGDDELASLALDDVEVDGDDVAVVDAFTSLVQL